MIVSSKTIATTESGLDEVEVGVMKENVKALGFYKRNGMNLEYHLLGMEF